MRRRKTSDVKPEDLIVFNQQFVALIRAGLPILRSLDLLRDRIINPELRRHMDDVRALVYSGAFLSAALDAQNIFPRVYTATVLAGERSGNLVEVITRYIQYQKTIHGVRRRFRNSLIYPAFLVALLVSMITVVLAYVVPRFAELYAGMNRALPLSTRLLIGFSATVRESVILMAPLLLGGIVAFRIWAGSARGRGWIDDLKLRLPLRL